MSSVKRSKIKSDIGDVSQIQQILDTIPPKHIYTRMSKVDKGVLITISNLGGCPKENSRGDDLTQTPCKNSFYQSIARFLRQNKFNRVVFMGNFIGNGPYAMTVIYNIMELLKEFNYSGGDVKNIEGENQVTIVAGDKDINLLRLKYELHKILLQQEVEHPEIDMNMKSMIRFKDLAARKQAKNYGNYVPYNFMFNKDFSKIYSQVMVSSLYQRVKNILQTCGCHIPSCLLFNVNFSEFYYLARNEQNIELMLLIEQLSVFTMAYPWVPEKKFEKYICTEEIFFIIEHILLKINEIIADLRRFRTDIYVRQMYEISHRLQTLVADPKKTKIYIEELMPLENWRNTMLHFYHNIRLIHYDETFHSIFLQFDPTYTLPTFINTFIPFSEYIRNDPNKEFVDKPKKGELWSMENYYSRISKMYAKFLSHKTVYRVCNKENNI